MKIDFNKPDEAQRPVSQAQTDMRKAKSRKWPIFKMFVFFAIVGGGAYGYWRWTEMETIYTYGLVASEIETFRAPHQGFVGQMTLTRGQAIKKGDVLYAIAPVVSKEEQEAKEEVRTSFAKAEANVEVKRQGELARARSEAQRLQALHEQEVERKEHAVNSAIVQVGKNEDIVEARRRHHAKMEDLRSLEAAVASDVEAAATALAAAQRDLEQALLDLDSARARTMPSQAAYDKALIDLELAVKTAGDTSALHLDKAQFELSVASRERQAMTFRAPEDGVVLEVAATEGSLVAANELIATVAAATPVWVDAFVRPKKAHSIKEGDGVLIFVAGNPEPVPGYVAAETGTSVRVPEVLRYKLPRMNTAVYVHVGVDDAHASKLLPGSEVRVVIPPGE